MNDLQPNIDSDLRLLEDIKAISAQRGAGNFNNMLPIVIVPIPNSVLISCPLARKQLRQGKVCIKCEHFNGVVQTTFNNEYEMPFEDKYAISCGFPVDRKLIGMSVE